MIHLPKFQPRDRRKAVIVIAAGALCISIAGCSSDSNGEGPTASGEVDREATIRLGVDAVPSTFDPIQNPGTLGNYTLPELYDQLVQLDADFQPEAMLATDWEFNDDGTELTMTLRDDAVFNGDGSPVDAEAVKASIERAKDDPKSQVGPSLMNVTGIEAVDDTTVTFSFATPAYSFVTELAADPRISSVVDPDHMDESLMTKPAGSGPYTLDEATASKISMSRVADHWDDTSGLAAKIELNAILDENSRFNAVKAGQLDATYITTGQAEEAEQIAEGGGFATFYEPQIQKYNLGVNATEGSPLADPKVRLAISKAIDRTQFCNTSFPGLSSPSSQFVSPLNPAYDESLNAADTLTAHPDEAKALLEEAGVDNLTIGLVAFGTLTTQAEILQQQLADAGITLETDIQGALPAVLEVWLGGGADSRFLSQSGAPDPTTIVRQSIESSPVSGGVPDYLTSALEANKTAVPGAELDAAAAEVNKILTEQPLNIPICDVGLGLLASSKVVGLEDVRFLGFSPPYESRRLGITG